MCKEETAKLEETLYACLTLHTPYPTEAFGLSHESVEKVTKNFIQTHFHYLTFKKNIFPADNRERTIKASLFDLVSYITGTKGNDSEIVIVNDIDVYSLTKQQKEPYPKMIGTVCKVLKFETSKITLLPIRNVYISEISEKSGIAKVYAIETEITTDSLDKEKKEYAKAFQLLHKCIHFQNNIFTYANNASEFFRLSESKYGINPTPETRNELIENTNKMIGFFELEPAEITFLLKTANLCSRLVELQDALREMRDILKCRYMLMLDSSDETNSDNSLITDDYYSQLELLDFQNKESIKEFVSKIAIPESYKTKINGILSYSSYKSNDIEYIRNLLKLPHKLADNINKTPESIMNTLNSVQYGMEEVKEKVLDYVILSQKIRHANLPVLCLNGKPGTGKTSLVYAISQALNRPLVKCSLAGVNDASTLIGFEYTYRSAIPGKIIRGMQSSPVSNPVFLLDEIDKVDNRYGDPISVLLSVLDPIQNNHFEDLYIGLPYDLSNVLFICTSNYKEMIPAALRNRMEIIDIPYYSDFEKVEICKNYIIPKLMDRYELNEGRIEINDDDILYIVQSYTREAGVRQLDRCLDTIVRKIVIYGMLPQDKQIILQRDLIQRWLGKEKYIQNIKKSTKVIGSCNGIGELNNGQENDNSVETICYPGPSTVMATGFTNQYSIDVIMKVYSIIKANYINLNCSEEILKNSVLHIHNCSSEILSTADNAAQFLVSLLSAINKAPVDNDLCIVGGVSFSGEIIAVHNFREKINAAYEAGYSKIIIPQANLDIDDHSLSEFNKKIEIIPISNISKLIWNVFENTNSCEVEEIC